MAATILAFKQRAGSPVIHDQAREAPLRRSRRHEDLLAFLVDLEREHGAEHRQVLEVLYGLSDDAEAAEALERESRERPMRLRKLLDQALMFGHKWFGLPEKEQELAPAA
ncbi:MAG: hypothetical protein U0166_00755 [Acidobacteriota bacterium]